MRINHYRGNLSHRGRVLAFACAEWVARAGIAREAGDGGVGVAAVFALIL